MTITKIIEPKGISSSTTSSIHNIELSIKQTWTKIQIISKTEKAKGIAISANIQLNNNDDKLLIYTYEAKPRLKYTDKFIYHRGTCTLTLDKIIKPTTLNGVFYTDRKKDIYGEISLVKSSK